MCLAGHGDDNTTRWNFSKMKVSLDKGNQLDGKEAKLCQSSPQLVVPFLPFLIGFRRHGICFALFDLPFTTSHSLNRILQDSGIPSDPIN